ASEIIAVDVSDQKLALARQIGADHAVNNKKEDALQRILQIAPGGVCASFDMVGADATLALAIGATRKLGRVVQIGLTGGTAHLQPLSSWQFEVLFTVSLWGSIKELREVLALADDGRLTPIPLEFQPLENINDVYHRLEQGLVNGRAVITP
ncbi:MAG TPA: zinc-binding dehydrogenase, partial [Acidobacteriota bacterium]|nr:zinc-binding dehydrogenase [Acidobacteriota bacterium]